MVSTVALALALTRTNQSTGPRFYVSLTAAALRLYAANADADAADAHGKGATAPPMPRALRTALWRHADERRGTVVALTMATLAMATLSPY